MKNSTLQATISVIIPVYNGEAYLAEAIESVLAQTLRPSEILVVDDGSTDSGQDVIKEFIPKVHYLYQQNSGTAAARNFGLHVASGNFLAFLDQDDLWEADKLEKQIHTFENDESPDVVFGHVQQFFSPDLDEETKAQLYCPGHPEPGYLPSAMLIKRDAFFRVGLFENQWQIGEWTNWFVRAKEAGLKMETLPDVLVKRRIHSQNKGILQRDRRTEYARILKESLDRRRAQSNLK